MSIYIAMVMFVARVLLKTQWVLAQISGGIIWLIRVLLKHVDDMTRNNKR